MVSPITSATTVVVTKSPRTLNRRGHHGTNAVPTMMIASKQWAKHNEYEFPDEDRKKRNQGSLSYLPAGRCPAKGLVLSSNQCPICACSNQIIIRPSAELPLVHSELQNFTNQSSYHVKLRAHQSMSRIQATALNAENAIRNLRNVFRSLTAA